MNMFGGVSLIVTCTDHADSKNDMHVVVFEVAAKPEFNLVIFDYDGILVDSELITNIVFAGRQNEHRLSVTLDNMFSEFVADRWTNVLISQRKDLAGPLLVISSMKLNFESKMVWRKAETIAGHQRGD